MMTAAQQDNMEEGFALRATGTDGSAALRQTVAERLARHRSRRAQQAERDAEQVAQRREEVRDIARSVALRARNGASEVREAVAARYGQSQSYREYLAAEAERALQQAQAEAEVAKRKAHAVAEAQIQLLEELETWKETERSPREQAMEQARTAVRGELAHALADIALGARELIREPSREPNREPKQASESGQLSFGSGPEAAFAGAVDTSGESTIGEARSAKPLTQVSAGGLIVKLYEGLETAKPVPAELKPNRRAAEPVFLAPEEIDELDAELELRHGTGMAMPHIIETTPIPANLIEFPRQLIAPRKARPRLAEGPLREEAPFEPQLRIFEVETEQIASEAVAAEPTGAPVWQELLLESTVIPAHEPPAEAQTQFTFQPQVAPIGRRLLATTVDGGCLLAAAAGFLELALHTGGAGLRHAPLPLVGAAAGVALLCFYTMYQMLFFTVSDRTPGMRAARIALCTFGDDNPSRKAMRMRVLATLLAACPLGIGLLWCFLDDEELGWHDRMSRMYQRGY